MMFDGNRATAWVEADEDDGIDESITLHFGRERSLVGFEIINGYDKDQKIWAANSRVEQLEARTGDGQVQVITLKDVRGASRFDFDAPVETSWLRLTIKSVYPGAKYGTPRSASSIRFSRIEVFGLSDRPFQHQALSGDLLRFTGNRSAAPCKARPSA